MLPSILKKLQMTPIPSTNLTNIIPSTNNFYTDSVLALTTSLMKNHPNTVVKIFYQIIKDNPYAIFLFIVMSVFIFTILLRFFIYAFTRKPNRTKRNIGKRLFNTLLSSRFIWTGFLLGIIVGIDVLSIPKPIAHLIKGCIFSILLWIFYIISNNLISLYTRAILIYKTQGTKIKFFKNKNIFIVFSRALHFTWVLIFITVLLGLWGVELGPILAGLGIVGIVVGLALQDALSHVVGGVSLMLDETYSEGDYVILDNNSEGIIFQIGYRSTKLRTFDEEVIIIPNGVLSKMIITNLSQPVKRSRINTFYTVFSEGYSPDQIKDFLLQATKSCSSVLKYPEPYSFFLEPKGNQYSFRLSFYTASPLNRLSCKDQVQHAVVKIFKDHNIRFGIEEKIMNFQNTDK